MLRLRVMGWWFVVSVAVVTVAVCVAVSALALTSTAASAAEVSEALAPGEAGASPPFADDQRVLLKLRDGSRVRLREGRFVAPPPVETGALESTLAAYGARVARLVAHTDEERLEALAREGEARSGRDVPEMSVWFDVALPGPEAHALVDALLSHPLVEHAYIAPRDAPPPGDIPPETGLCDTSQGYRFDAPGGLAAEYGWNFPGGRGEGVFVIDVEYDWIEDHEDLDAALGRELVYVPRALYEDHGTAVLGEMIGTEDVWGITGMIPGATIGMVTQYPEGMSNSVARAITAAAGLQSAGDVLLIEAQTYGPTGAYVPVEWNQAEYDAIVNATARGITVVEAAGNGGVNLDGPEYLGRFTRSVRDSGAIIVGAGAAPGGFFTDRSRLSFSCYGSRLDMQGWGELVATTGYSDWCGGTLDDMRQRYRPDFSGTSSASPLVASTAAAVQGVLMARGDAPLTPATLRDLLARTGSPQQAGFFNGNIGPRPDLRAALRDLLGGVLYEAHALADLAPGGNDDGAADPGETVSLELCLHNAGDAAATDVVARLVNPVPAWLKITRDENATFGTLAPGATACSSAPHFSLVLEPDAPCGESFHLDVAITSGLGTETTTLRFVVGARGTCVPRACADSESDAVDPALTLAKEGAQDVRFTWPQLAGADGYRVWRARAIDFADERLAGESFAGTAASLLVEDEGAPVLGMTYYVVRAKNACGWEGP